MARRHSAVVLGLPDLFWSKVMVYPTPDACWEWQASKNKKGYGRFALAREVKLAHRLSYEAVLGPVPSGLQLDHLCRTPSCVRPDHLEPVSSRVNTMRGQGVAAEFARRTHCGKGHEYTPENLIPGVGHRQCRACFRIKDRDRKRRIRAEKAGIGGTA